jgi:recombination associated protein RdgC
MMFRNLCIYRLPKPLAINAERLEEQLSTRQLQGCGSTDTLAIGWVAPRAGGNLVHVVNGQFLLACGVDQKILPASVIIQFANAKAKTIEENEGRRVGRREMRELRESVKLELLPRAFIRCRTTFGWIDPANGWLVIDAASPARAEEFLEHLRKSVAGMPVALLQVKTPPIAAMTGWVAGGDGPAGFTLDHDLALSSAEHAEVRYVKHSLEGEAIRQYISEGKVATKLAMTWRDRISFVLTENLQIKRLSILDIVKDQADGQAENEDERFDIDFTLMTGEVAKLLDDLVAAVGGEQEKEPA